jgi:hypothetical protein
LLGALGGVGLLVVACSGDDGKDASPGGGAGTGTTAGEVTFYRDVLPILDQHCNSCHREGGIGPFALTTYDQAMVNADGIAFETGHGTMPPWHAVDSAACQTKLPWKDDLRLTDAQKATLKQWAATGAKRGDEGDAPPAFVPGPDGLEAPTGTLTPKAPFTTSGNNDQFRCFVLDPGLASDSYLKGIAVVPGDPAVVHHALIFADEERESLKLADADGGYTCFGDSRTSNPKLVGAWAPGGLPEQFPDNVGIPLKQGSLLVMQVHYHPGGRAGVTDQTSLQVAFSTEKPAYSLFPLLLGNAGSEKGGLLPGPDDREGKVEFRIPANVVGHTETMQYKLTKGLLALGGLPPEVGVYSAATHMHWVGRDMHIQVVHPEGEVDASGTEQPGGTECLIGTPDYDFSWQRSYRYDSALEALPKIHGGDTVRLTCTYDNDKSNKRLMSALMEEHITEPRDVTLGESTTDEMCIASLALLYPTP